LLKWLLLLMLLSSCPELKMFKLSVLPGISHGSMTTGLESTQVFTSGKKERNLTINETTMHIINTLGSCYRAGALA